METCNCVLWNLGLLVSNAGLRDVRFAAENVRYSRKSGHSAAQLACPLWAKSDKLPACHLKGVDRATVFDPILEGAEVINSR
jgi:hypothetical protein